MVTWYGFNITKMDWFSCSFNRNFLRHHRYKKLEMRSYRTISRHLLCWPYQKLHIARHHHTRSNPIGTYPLTGEKNIKSQRNFPCYPESYNLKQKNKKGERKSGTQCHWKIQTAHNRDMWREWAMCSVAWWS